MKLAFITTGDIKDIATSKRAFGMADPLKRLGYEVTIIAEDTPTNRQRIEQEAPNTSAIWFPSCDAISENRFKRQILKKLKPDFVYVGALGIRNLAWSPFLSRKCCYILEHSELASAIRNQPARRRMVSLALEKLSLILFTGHVAASHYLGSYLKGELSRYYLDRSVHYSPYAYSPSMLVPDPKISEMLQEKIGGRKVVLYMGTLSRNYGILDIIKAAEIVRKKNSDVLFLILGKGRDGVAASRLVDRLNLQEAVQLEGYVPDQALPSYLEAADIFLSPLYNTVQDLARCPSKLFLYLPYQRPIVTSPIGEAEALFGHKGYYFMPGNIEEMALVIEDALGAGSSWSPDWNLEDHSWERRAIEMDIWLRSLAAK